MKTVRTRKLFKSVTQYKAEVNRCYVLHKVGTNDTATQEIIIDGKIVGQVRADFSPLRAVDTNRWGLCDLGDNFLVIPPNIVFTTKGAADKLIAFDGEVIILEAGETVPAVYMDRFAKQGVLHTRFAKLEYKHGKDVVFKKDAEVTIGTIKPLGNEAYKINNILGVGYSNITISDGDIGIILTLDGAPLDQITGEMGLKGIDLFQIPFPPTDTTQQDVLNFKEQPIELEPLHELGVVAINNSGADITPATGTEMVLACLLVYQYERVA